MMGNEMPWWDNSPRAHLEQTHLAVILHRVNTVYEPNRQKLVPEMCILSSHLLLIYSTSQSFQQRHLQFQFLKYLVRKTS